MERKGAAYRITQSRPAGTEPASRQNIYPWNPSNSIGTDIEANDDETRLAMSVSRHPSGGHESEVTRFNSWDPEDPSAHQYSAGPFRTQRRAQIAAESLGQRVVGDSDKADQYHRRYI